MRQVRNAKDGHEEEVSGRHKHFYSSLSSILHIFSLSLSLSCYTLFMRIMREFKDQVLNSIIIVIMNVILGMLPQKKLISKQSSSTRKKFSLIHLPPFFVLSFHPLLIDAVLFIAKNVLSFPFTHLSVHLMPKK